MPQTPQTPQTPKTILMPQTFEKGFGIRKSKRKTNKKKAKTNKNKTK